MLNINQLVVACENNEIKVTASIFDVTQCASISGQNSLAFRHNQFFSVEGTSDTHSHLFSHTHTGCSNKNNITALTHLALVIGFHNQHCHLHDTVTQKMYKCTYRHLCTHTHTHIYKKTYTHIPVVSVRTVFFKQDLTRLSVLE